MASFASDVANTIQRELRFISRIVTEQATLALSKVPTNLTPPQKQFQLLLLDLTKKQTVLSQEPMENCALLMASLKAVTRDFLTMQGMVDNNDRQIINARRNNTRIHETFRKIPLNAVYSQNARSNNGRRNSGDIRRELALQEANSEIIQYMSDMRLSAAKMKSPALLDLLKKTLTDKGQGLAVAKYVVTLYAKLSDSTDNAMNRSDLLYESLKDLQYIADSRKTQNDINTIIKRWNDDQDSKNARQKQTQTRAR